jgi:MYXO-CTERM domain-containing protein
MTHSRMMQSLATCFLSAAPSPPPPPPPRFPFFWPLPLLGLFIVPAGRRRVNGGTEGEELSAKAPAAARYRWICISPAAVMCSVQLVR